jgi:hypothetical protein
MASESCISKLNEFQFIRHTCLYPQIGNYYYYYIQKVERKNVERQNVENKTSIYKTSTRQNADNDNTSKGSFKE